MERVRTPIQQDAERLSIIWDIWHWQKVWELNSPNLSGRLDVRTTCTAQLHAATKSMRRFNHSKEANAAPTLFPHGASSGHAKLFTSPGHITLATKSHLGLVATRVHAKHAPNHSSLPTGPRRTVCTLLHAKCAPNAPHLANTHHFQSRTITTHGGSALF